MEVRPMTSADLVGVVDISISAFFGDELFTWLCPRHQDYPDAWRRFMTIRQQVNFNTIGLWGLVCVDEDDRILGYSWWSRIRPDMTSAAAKADLWIQNNRSWSSWLERLLRKAEEKYDRVVQSNPAVDYETLREYLSDHEAASIWDPLEKHAAHWHLRALGVSPEAQRKGVGGMLLNWGIEKARQETERTGVAVPISLTASPAGKGLYSKNGFKIVAYQAIVLVDDSPLQGGAALVWDPTQTWIRPAPPGTEVRPGKPIEAVWTDRASKRIA